METSNINPKGIDGLTPEMAVEMLVAQTTEQNLKTRSSTLRETQGARWDAKIEHQQKEVEAAKKAEKAAQGGLIAKIFGWIKSILGVLAAAFATVATAGAASPALAAMLVLSVVDFVGQIAKEASGGQVNIDVAGLCGKMMYGLARAFGASEEQAKNAETWGGMALATVLQLGVGFMAMPGQVGNAANAAANAEKMSQQFTTLANVFNRIPGAKPLAESFEQLAKTENTIRMMNLLMKSQKTIGYMDAVGTMGDAAASAVHGGLNYSAAMSKADLQKSLSNLRFMESMFDQQVKEIKRANEEHASVVKKVQENVESRGDTAKSITDNFGSGGGGSSIPSFGMA